MATNAELQAEIKKLNAQLAENESVTAENEALKEQLAQAEKPAQDICSQNVLTEEDEAVRKAKELNKKAKELVTIRLFGDGSKYKDDLFVQVNTYKVLIPRQKYVKVPRFVAEVIENMDEQITYADKLVDGLVDEYEKNAVKALS